MCITINCITLSTFFFQCFAPTSPPYPPRFHSEYKTVTWWPELDKCLHNFLAFNSKKHCANLLPNFPHVFIKFFSIQSCDARFKLKFLRPISFNVKIFSIVNRAPFKNATNCNCNSTLQFVWCFCVRIEKRNAKRAAKITTVNIAEHETILCRGPVKGGFVQ